MTRAARLAALLAALLAASCSGDRGQPGVADEDAGGADVIAGGEIYVTHCEMCHGKDGRPMNPGTPDFSRGEGLLVGDDELIRRTREGIGAMPAYGGLLSDDEIRDVIAYLHTLQR